MKPRVLVVVGTRPEVVKLAPVVSALERRGDAFERPYVLFTGQHRELLEQMASAFGLVADENLALMRDGQSLPALTSRLVEGLDQVFEAQRPDIVLAQGDTTTVFTAALVCYYRQLRFGHVEAGLRTDDLYRPFPEEGNRRLVAPLAAWHFAPTAAAAENLLREGVLPSRVHVTGNTVIDALLSMAARSAVSLPCPGGDVTVDPVSAPSPSRRLLLTLHRRESFGAPLEAILNGLAGLLTDYPDLELIYPVHPNPHVRGPAAAALGHLPNARLIDPLAYPEFVAAMKGASVILTDSGGVQEEAPALGVPVLVLRDTTERPEGVAAGVARLVGTDPAAIRAATLEALSSPRGAPRSPYGDGSAGDRIAALLAGESPAPFIDDVGRRTPFL